MEASEHAELLQRWERAAAGWERQAERIRESTTAVSAWMIDRLALEPGQRVLELAAGPGDTGFMAAELIRPGGTLVSGDATEAMLAVARERARRLGIDNVEFKRLELEWIDLPTASVDATLCRWGLMLSVDPAAAAQECRRVLRPGGRLALAVWDSPERNPWATTPGRALIELGHAEPPDANAPGMFALADPGRLRELLESAGFCEVAVESIAVSRSHGGIREYLKETLDLSRPFAEVYEQLTDEQRGQVRLRIESLAAPFTEADGSLRFPAATLVAAAQA